VHALFLRLSASNCYVQLLKRGHGATGASSQPPAAGLAAQKLSLHFAQQYVRTNQVCTY